MAEGDSDGPKWPKTVTFQEPKKGFAQISLQIDGMLVKKPTLGLFGKAKPTNATILQEEFKSEMVIFQVEVTHSDGDKKVIEYKKKLPEVIVPESCEYEVKNGWLVLHLCKEKDQPWASYHKELGKRDV